LRNEIRGNLNVLINKLSDVYDLDKWGHTDTRNNFLQTNSIDDNFNNNYYNNRNHSTENEFYFNSKSESKKFNKTDADKFKTILRQKVINMSIDNNTKTRLTKNYDKFNDSSTDKFYKPKMTNIIAKEAFLSENSNAENNKSEKENLNNSAENKKTKNFNLTTHPNLNNLNTTRNHLNNYNNTNNIKTNYRSGIIDINDKFNIGKLTLPAVATKYSSVNPDFSVNLTEVDKLRKDNWKIYDRFKDTTLFKDFPSPDRKEFVVKKGEKLRINSKKDKIDKTQLDFSNYNATKHKHVFCEDYDTNDSVMVKFKKSKEVF